MTDKIQALEAQLANASNPPEKVDRLNDLAQALVNSHPERAKELALEARQLATDTLSTASPHVKGLTTSLRTLANVAARQAHYEEANVYLEEALVLYEKNEDKAGCASALQTLSFNYVRCGNLSTAVDYGVRALALAEEIGSESQKAGALGSLAAAATQMGEYDQALRYYEQAHAIHEQGQDYERISVTLNNIAYTHFLAGSYEKTLSYARQGLELIAEHKIEAIHELYLVNNAAHAYRHLGQYHEALQLYKQNIVNLEQRDDKLIRLADLLGTGQIYLAQNELDLAQTTLQEALPLAEEIKIQPFYYECHQTLAQLYERRGQYEQALAHYQQFHALKEHIHTEEASEIARRLERQYRAENAQREAELSQQQNIALEQEIRERQTAETALRQSQEMLQDFLEKQQHLVEINITLSRAADMDELCRLSIVYGLEQLGFERLGLYLLDETKQRATGTYGTDGEGNVQKEDQFTIDIAEQPWLAGWVDRETRVVVVEDADLYTNNVVVGRGWSIRVGLWQEDTILGFLFADNLLQQRPLQPYQSDLLSAYGTIIANLILRKRAERLLQERLKALNCLTDIGYKIDETPNIPEFLHWLTERIPSAMQHPEICKVAISYQDQVYGTAAAIDWSAQMVQSIRVGHEQVGRIYVAYQEKTPFVNEESALMGGIARRVAGYIENQQLTAQTQATLTEANTFRQLVLASGQGIGIADLQGNAIYANPTLLHLLQIENPEETFYHQPVFHFYPEDIQKRLQEEVIPTIMQEGQWQDELSMQINERIIPTYENHFLLRDEAGNPAQIASVITDITERKHAEQLLQEEKERNQAILESLSTPIVIAKVANGTLIYVNEPLADMIRTPRDQLIGRLTPDFFYNPTDRQAYVSLLREKKQVTNYEVYLKRGDGDPFWALMSGRIAQFEGELVTITSLIDISDRKAAEAAIQKQAIELRTVAEVSTVAATVRETTVLLQEVVDLAKERFNLYHVHIYLLNSMANRLVLAAGAGSVGRSMSTHGHSIPINNERSLVAQAARERKGIIVNDVHQDPNFLPNPLLPDTLSELAVPLIIGDSLVGVLDVQASELNRFSESDVVIQTTLASQIAVALENARSFERSQKALADLNELTQRLTREGWENYLDSKAETVLAYSFSAEQLESTPQTITGSNGNGIDATQQADEGQFAQPITIHGEQIGQLSIVPEDDANTEDDEETAAIIAAVATQLSARLENIRLTEQTQTALAETEEQAQRLAHLNDAAAALNAAQNAEDVFQVAVNQTLFIIKGNRASITLLNEEENALTVMAVNGIEVETIPLGTTFPLTEQKSFTTAIKERRVVIDEASQTSGTGGLTHSYSSIIAPILSGTRVLGTINVGSDQIHAFGSNDINLMRQIAALIATTIENQRLFDETQARAEQLAAINRVTQALSQYLDQDELLEAAYEQIKQTVDADAFFIGLYDPETEYITYPILYEAGHRNHQDPVKLVPANFSYRVIYEGETILKHMTPAEVQALPNKPSALIGDREQPHTPASLIYVPLQSGQQVRGVLSAQSYRYNVYSQADVSLLNGIASYLAVAMENVRLFTETEKRAVQLQALSEVEIALSQAITEEEILTAVSLSVQVSTEIPTLMLNYIDTGSSDQPQTIRVVAVWSDGMIQTEHPALGFTINMTDDSGEQFWVNRPNEVNYFHDIWTDENINDRMRQRAKQEGFRTMVILPLQSGGRWQGSIALTWQEVHELSDSERFLLRQIMEPIAAVLASRRAQLAQQAALALTDNLYRAGRRINTAGPDLQEAVAAVAEAAPIPAINRLVLFLFEFTPTAELAAAHSAANWYSGVGTPPPQLGLRYTPDVLKGLELFVTRDVLIFTDTAHDEQLHPTMRAVLQRLKIPSMVVVPMWVGSRQLGSILLETDKPYVFHEPDLEPYIALASQLTVAVDRQHLLQQAQARAERERQIRTITDKIRRGIDRDAILRIAQEEIKQLLGASTSVAQVGTQAQLLRQLQKLTASQTETIVDKTAA